MGDISKDITFAGGRAQGYSVTTAPAINIEKPFGGGAAQGEATTEGEFYIDETTVFFGGGHAQGIATTPGAVWFSTREGHD